MSIININNNKNNRQQQQNHQRRLILSEEDYTSTLSSIVERDYFPDNQRLQAQNALLDARIRGDVAGAVAIRRATRKLLEHEEAIAVQRQQDDQDLMTEQQTTTTGIRKRPRPLQEETITGFHARATNEDDHEFDSNLKQEIAENRQRLQDVFQGGKKAKDDDDDNDAKNKNWLLLEEMASDDFAPESNQIAPSEWKKPGMKNSLFFNPSPLRGSNSELQDQGQPKLLTSHHQQDTIQIQKLHHPLRHQLLCCHHHQSNNKQKMEHW